MCMSNVCSVQSRGEGTAHLVISGANEIRLIFLLVVT